MPARSWVSSTWKIALCSESTGSNVVPDSSTCRVISSPAQTSASLLANATVAQLRTAARVGARPAAPTIAAIIQSTDREAASINASGPAAASTALPDRASLSSP